MRISSLFGIALTFLIFCNDAFSAANAAENTPIYSYNKRIKNSTVSALYGNQYSDIRYDSDGDRKFDVILLTNSNLTVQQRFSPKGKLEYMEIEKRYEKANLKLVYRRNKNNQLVRVAKYLYPNKTYFNFNSITKTCMLRAAGLNPWDTDFKEIKEMASKTYQNSLWTSAIDESTCGPILNDSKQTELNLMDTLKEIVSQTYSIDPESALEDSKNSLLSCLNNESATKMLLPSMLKFLMTQPLKAKFSTSGEKIITCAKAGQGQTGNSAMFKSQGLGQITLMLSTPVVAANLKKEIQKNLLHEALHASLTDPMASCGSEGEIQKITDLCLESSIPKEPLNSCTARLDDGTFENQKTSGLGSFAAVAACDAECKNIPTVFTQAEAEGFAPAPETLAVGGMGLGTVAQNAVITAGATTLIRINSLLPGNTAFANPVFAQPKLAGTAAPSKPPTPGGNPSRAPASVTNLQSPPPDSSAASAAVPPAARAAAITPAGPNKVSATLADGSGNASAPPGARPGLVSGRAISGDSSAPAPQRGPASIPPRKQKFQPDPKKANLATVLEYMNTLPPEEAERYAAENQRTLGTKGISFVNIVTNKTYGLPASKAKAVFVRNGDRLRREDQ